MDSAARERIIAQLIDAGRTCVARGLVQASGGNLSARLEGSDTFVITATGTWLDALTPDDFVEIGVEGTQRSPGRASGEWKLHQRTYAVRPHVNAIVHLHPQHVVLVDMLGHPIRCTTLDHAYYLGEIGRVDFLSSGSDELADAVAERSRHHDAVILAHHGCSTVGESVPMALRRALNLEEAAMMTYRLLVAGDTTTDFPAQWRDRIITI